MSDERPIAIQIEDLVKTYKIGAYNSRTFLQELQSKRAKRRGKDDPNTRIGQNTRLIGSTLYALNGVSATIYQGETVGIIGANGAGKSTLLKLISNITIPTSGRIGINGRISSMLEVGVGFMPEMTGKENIYMNGAILGMSRAEVDRKLADIIAFSECEKFIDTPIKRYSSGMRLKLAFSIAAHLDNEIMIMDEVLAVGDQQFQRKCLDRMLDASVTEGKTVLYVSHNMATIRQLCRRCIVLEQGKVAFDGATDEAINVYSQKTSRAVCRGDLRQATRSGRGSRRSAEILAFDAVGRELAQYARGEALRLTIDWELHADVERVFPFFQVYNANSEPLGCIFPENPVPTDGQHAYRTAFTLDTSSFSFGDYQLSFGFVKDYGDFDRRLFMDNVDRFFSFEIRPSSERDSFSHWNQQRDGAIFFPAFGCASLGKDVAYDAARTDA